jgi:hypothetical protein
MKRAYKFLAAHTYGMSPKLWWLAMIFDGLFTGAAIWILSQIL